MHNIRRKYEQCHLFTEATGINAFQLISNAAQHVGYEDTISDSLNVALAG